VALLRGVNVSGHNRLPMAALRAVLTDAGFHDVRTYIQSGNVGFRAPAALARRLPALIARHFGLTVPAVLRTTAELRAVVRANPFLRAGADPRGCYVAFLADRPTRARVAALDPDRSPPDRFAVRGREVYLWLRNGAARTKLTADWFDARLATVSTHRNWRTACTLAAWT
jgi:uncharacterized protein (DUF1697 family)